VNSIVIGGVMVIVLTIGPKVCGFKPRKERNGVLRAIKVCNMIFFGEEVKVVSPMS
jgi:hypothetical protein